MDIPEIDEENDYKVVFLKDPRVTTLIQKQTLPDITGKPDNFYVSKTSARVFAPTAVVREDIMNSGAKLFKSSCIVHERLTPALGQSPPQYLHVFKTNGNFVQLILNFITQKIEAEGVQRFEFRSSSAPSQIGSSCRKYKEIMDSLRDSIKDQLRTDNKVDFIIDVEDAGVGTSRIVMTTWTAVETDRPSKIQNIAAAPFLARKVGRNMNAVESTSRSNSEKESRTNVAGLKVLRNFFNVVQVIFDKYNRDGRGKHVDAEDAKVFVSSLQRAPEPTSAETDLIHRGLTLADTKGFKALPGSAHPRCMVKTFKKVDIESKSIFGMTKTQIDVPAVE